MLAPVFSSRMGPWLEEAALMQVMPMGYEKGRGIVVSQEHR